MTEKQLRTFCGSKECEWYTPHNPFNCNGYRYATDGRIIVRKPTGGKDSVGKFPFSTFAGLPWWKCSKVKMPAMPAGTVEEHIYHECKVFKCSLYICDMRYINKLKRVGIIGSGYPETRSSAIPFRLKGGEALLMPMHDGCLKR